MSSITIASSATKAGIAAAMPMAPGMLAKAFVVSGVLGYTHPAMPDTTKMENKVYHAWITQVASPIRFFISGNLGNVAFASLEPLIGKSLLTLPLLKGVVDKFGKESLAFTIGYVLEIVVQHILHAVLVYGLYTINTTPRYMLTLLGEAAIYGASLFGSTYFNMQLLETLKLDRALAFAITMAAFAIINYYTIGTWVRWVMEWTPEKDAAPQASSNGNKKKQKVSKPQPPKVTTSSTVATVKPPPPPAPPAVVPVKKVTNDKKKASGKKTGVVAKKNEGLGSGKALGLVGATLLAGGYALAETVFAGNGSDAGSKPAPKEKAKPAPPALKAAPKKKVTASANSKDNTESRAQKLAKEIKGMVKESTELYGNELDGEAPTKE